MSSNSSVRITTEPGETACYSTAAVRRATTLYREPGGARRLRITPKTEWGSPRVLGVVSQRGDWLGVQASELRNGEIGATDVYRALVHNDAKLAYPEVAAWLDGKAPMPAALAREEVQA